MSEPERKASPASMLVAPRNPVTRWNRKALMAGAGVLAGLVALGFYLGFGGAKPRGAGQVDAQASVDTSSPQRPEIAGRFAQGYGDPGLQPPALGTATLPPPGTQVPVGVSETTPLPPAPPDPAFQAAREEARAASGAGPFFQGGDRAVASSEPSMSGYAGAPGLASPAEPVAEVGPQNGQAAKRQFLAGAKSQDYLTNTLLAPLSPWEIKAGTLIPAALITAINSDLPGEVVAQVTRPVYDHVSGKTVLIPQGSRLIGQYDAQVAYGQDRALVAWTRIIMPNGSSINLSAMPGTDLSGASGLSDRTDGHFGQLARGIVLSTLFSIGAASAQDAGNRSSGGLVINSTANGVANQAQQVGQRITERDLGRQPTLRIRAGWPVQVLVNKDIVLAPYPAP